jgi:hypothetical protein
MIGSGGVSTEFSSERDLVDVLVGELASLYESGLPVLQAREVPNAARVIDVVVVFGADDPAPLLLEWEMPLRRLRALDRAHLSLLALVWAEKCISLSRLSRLTWTESEILRRRYLNTLVEAGLVECSARNTVTPTGWATWRSGRIVAVEAKLSDWRGCLAQAADNARWADVSYTAFPASGPLSVKGVLLALKSQGLGGIEVDRQGMSIVVPPRAKSQALSRRRAEFALGILRDMLHGSRWSAA